MPSQRHQTHSIRSQRKLPSKKSQNNSLLARMTTVQKSTAFKATHKAPEKKHEPIFRNQLEELEYWKAQAEEKEKELKDLEVSFDDFQQSSKELETEMERELTANEKKLKDLTSLYHRLKSEHDETIEKSRRIAEDSGKMIHNLQDEAEVLKKSSKDLRREKQRLEQDNDELERRVREAEASLQDLTEKMNKTLEENSYLQTELEETKNRSQETIQRMKDEIRDLKLELELLQETESSGNERSNVVPKSKQPTVASNVPRKASALVRTRSKEGSVELVDDILSLVKDMEWKLLSQKMDSSNSAPLGDDESY